jgi:hypothetical protein
MKRITVTRSWKKIMAVGCSHGLYQSDQAVAAALKFRQEWRPHTMVHLGDFIDTACLRSGADGHHDEGVSLDRDFRAAGDLLQALEPTLVFVGNHEDRIYGYVEHPRARLAYMAHKCVEDVRTMIRKVKAEFVEEYDIVRGWRKIGDTLFGHGFMYNDNALRDHAETFGKCCIAHIHTPGQANGRTLDRPTATCVGMLADEDKLSYARRRRGLLKWNNGWVFGEYCATETVLWVIQKSKTGEFRHP